MTVMRRFLGAAVLACALAFSACGGAGGTEDVKTEAAAAVAGYGFTYGQNRYVPGADAEETLKLLGEPTGSRDVNNCARGAVRKAYSYGDRDFEVFADLNADETKDVIQTITLMSERVSTEEGLSVGDEESRVKEIYPDCEERDGEYVVSKDGTEIAVSVNRLRKTVSYITYRTAE
ncbi:MAG: hypothetical protein K6E83_09580 [Clostridium sp.]|nr:hypothetical protein [Clostridium sp.]